MPNKLKTDDKSYEDNWFIFDSYYEIADGLYYNAKLNNLITFYSDKEETPFDVVTNISMLDMDNIIHYLTESENTAVGFFNSSYSKNTITSILVTNAEKILILRRKNSQGVAKGIDDIIYSKNPKLMYKRFAIVKDL